MPPISPPECWRSQQQPRGRNRTVRTQADQDDRTGRIQRQRRPRLAKGVDRAGAGAGDVPAGMFGSRAHIHQLQRLACLQGRVQRLWRHLRHAAPGPPPGLLHAGSAVNRCSMRLAKASYLCTPTNRSTTAPLAMKSTVGMPMTSKRAALRGFSSTSSLATITRSP